MLIVCYVFCKDHTNLYDGVNIGTVNRQRHNNTLKQPTVQYFNNLKWEGKKLIENFNNL